MGTLLLVQMGVLIWDDVHSHPVNRWELSRTDVQAPWHGMAYWRQCGSFVTKREREREFIGTNIKQFHAKIKLGDGTPKRPKAAVCNVVTKHPSQSQKVTEECNTCQLLKWLKVLGACDFCPTLLCDIWIQRKRTGFCHWSWL